MLLNAYLSTALHYNFSLNQLNHLFKSLVGELARVILSHKKSKVELTKLDLTYLVPI